MSKQDKQIVRVLVEGFASAFAILLFCMEMHKLGLIYGSGWYTVWIIGLTMFTGAVWFLLETNIRISFDHEETPLTTQPAITTNTIRGMITQALYDLREEPTKELEEQYQPEFTDDEVTVLTTRSVKEV